MAVAVVGSLVVAVYGLNAFLPNAAYAQQSVSAPGTGGGRGVGGAQTGGGHGGAGGGVGDFGTAEDRLRINGDSLRQSLGGPDGLGPVVPNEILVTVRGLRDADILEAIGRTHNITLRRFSQLPSVNTTVGRYIIDDPQRLVQEVLELADDPRIDGVQLNNYYIAQQAAAGRSGAQVSEAQPAQYAHRIMHLPEAHVRSRGNGAIIAVIDSGIDASHPDLRDKLWRMEDTLDPEDAGSDYGHSHGTAVAGIIVAEGAVLGVAPNSRIMGIRAFSPHKDKPQLAVGTTETVARALDMAINEGVSLINVSFAGPKDALIELLIRRALKNDIAVVASAGNGGPDADPAYPAAYRGVIAVTATNDRDEIYGSATRGSYVQVAAPGVSVLAPAPGGHNLFTGTSFAAAHVSGLAMLLMDLDEQIEPRDLQFILMRTSVDLGKPGPDDAFGAGRIDSLAAMDMATRLESERQ